jgi:hypothetical protein
MISPLLTILGIRAIPVNYQTDWRVRSRLMGSFAQFLIEERNYVHPEGLLL